MMDWVKILLSLGVEVWNAVKSGDKSKTVEEIFESRKSDMSTIEELEAEALEHYKNKD